MQELNVLAERNSVAASIECCASTDFSLVYFSNLVYFTHLYYTILFVTSPAGDGKYSDKYVYVSMSVCSHISRTTCPIFTKLSTHAISVTEALSSSDDSARLPVL